MNTIATEESDGEQRHQARDAAAARGSTTVPQDGVARRRGIDQTGRITTGPSISQERRRERWLRLFGGAYTIFSSDAGAKSLRAGGGGGEGGGEGGVVVVVVVLVWKKKHHPFNLPFRTPMAMAPTHTRTLLDVWGLAGLFGIAA